ncbi:type II toxin-antitoxin system CcdA family antitoxin [Sulfitobacter geojensis]|uniref:type II toxin-antitoxin system CcdA family antitoxin n=1 Tax=Sulfitobacter geojensis TaxID=1342299 RepID=UPI0024932B4D|nr:type II toxin-antitoxin system CcdA family antitoxin [Sulfitobacter geojensis]
MGVQKRATNLSLDKELLKDAKALGVNISAAAEQGLRQALRDAWLAENRESMEAWGEWVEKNGLPLEEYRMFDV